MANKKNKHDADSGDDGTSDAIINKEHLIDPGNEHTHNKQADDKLSGNNTGDIINEKPEPAEDENNMTDISDEDG